MRRFLLLLLAPLIAADAWAVAVVAVGEVIVGPWWTPFGMIAPPAVIYDPWGRCLTPMNCPDYEQMRRFLDRYERNYGQRFLPDRPPPSLPAGPRDVPPTPEGNIQPAYRGASQVRPEFGESGAPRGDRPPAGW